MSLAAIRITKAKEAVASALYYARCCVKRDIDNLKKKHAEELERLKNLSSKAKMEKIFDDDWKKTMTVLERDALTIARYIVGSIKTDSIFTHVETDSCLLSGEVIKFLHLNPVDKDKLSRGEKEIWASTLMSEAARSVQTRADTKNTRKIPSGHVLWHGWGIISPTGLVLEAIRDRSHYIVERLDTMRSGARFVKVEAVLIPATRRLKTK